MGQKATLFLSRPTGRDHRATVGENGKSFPAIQRLPCPARRGRKPGGGALIVGLADSSKEALGDGGRIRCGTDVWDENAGSADEGGRVAGTEPCATDNLAGLRPLARVASSARLSNTKRHWRRPSCKRQSCALSRAYRREGESMSSALGINSARVDFCRILQVGQWRTHIAPRREGQTENPRRLYRVRIDQVSVAWERPKTVPGSGEMRTIATDHWYARSALPHLGQRRADAPRHLCLLTLHFATQTSSWCTRLDRIAGSVARCRAASISVAISASTSSAQRQPSRSKSATFLVLQLAQLVEECRQRRIIDPPPRRPERLYIGVRYPARRGVYRRRTDCLSADQRRHPQCAAAASGGGRPCCGRRLL